MGFDIEGLEHDIQKSIGVLSEVSGLPVVKWSTSAKFGDKILDKFPFSAHLNLGGVYTFDFWHNMVKGGMMASLVLCGRRRIAGSNLLTRMMERLLNRRGVLVRVTIGLR
tara:strand:- start:150 stop:479 length:330 start_codon:yes stop_codon:yes gene_type:complete